MNLREWLKYGESQLLLGPHPQFARQDAESLLLGRLAENRAWLFAHMDEALPPNEADLYMACLEERASGKPVQQIKGVCEFYGLPLRVTPDILIPRPETELLVERAILLARNVDCPDILDVGTGSGAIAIALAKHLTDARLVATDISRAALEVAELNAGQNGVGERIRFVEGDLLAPVAGEKFDLVVSNPPYVPEADRESLTVEVRDHEPALALFAGMDGLDAYRRLIPGAPSVLNPGGTIAMEIGYGQSEPVAAMLADAGFEQIEFAHDLQGIPRVACARRMGSIALRGGAYFSLHQYSGSGPGRKQRSPAR